MHSASTSPYDLWKLINPSSFFSPPIISSTLRLLSYSWLPLGDSFECAPRSWSRILSLSSCSIHPTSYQWTVDHCLWQLSEGAQIDRLISRWTFAPATLWWLSTPQLLPTLWSSRQWRGGPSNEPDQGEMGQRCPSPTRKTIKGTLECAGCSAVHGCCWRGLGNQYIYGQKVWFPPP